MVDERNSPTYPRLVPKINPPTIGPIVCPISIIVSRKPVEVPTNWLGTSSVIRGHVDAVTVAKPNPYINERIKMILRSDEYGNIVNGAEQMIRPRIIGLRLPVLSESLPMYDLAKMASTMMLPDTAAVEKKSKCRVSFKYPERK